MIKTKFAENFNDLLRIKGISQSQFARLYGVKQNTVSQWVNGKREPTYHDLVKICTLLNVDIKEILGFNPRTKQEILRDIIGGNQDFQNMQIELQAKLRKEGKSPTEISKTCNELYEERFNEYKEIFGFDY